MINAIGTLNAGGPTVNGCVRPTDEERKNALLNGPLRASREGGGGGVGGVGGREERTREDGVVSAPGDEGVGDGADGASSGRGKGRKRGRSSRKKRGGPRGEAQRDAPTEGDGKRPRNSMPDDRPGGTENDRRGSAPTERDVEEASNREGGRNTEM